MRPPDPVQIRGESCSERDPVTGRRCERRFGHTGQHWVTVSKVVSWPDQLSFDTLGKTEEVK